ncbi:ribonuclease HII [Mycoplasmopsis gallinarum]|uniref:ribonuclease HII n=1 Tax=Mycoplasmopsis gallinarum TaxID=29557 RepID=UPI00055B863A|nr:ribonuclease HII [Mycoplasmopsis gallinarum]
MKFNIDEKYWKESKYILGLDEAGRGCCAGPLVVAGVIFPINYQNEMIDDSKKLTEKRRNEVFEIIKKEALKYEILVIDAKTVDKMNPKQASIWGMQEITTKLKENWNLVITDFEKLKNINETEQLNLVKGDSLSLSVAAASILAKVTRDNLMIEEYDKKFPSWNFVKHKGYATKEHNLKIQEFGICPIHRLSYKNVIENLIIFNKNKENR